MYVLSSDQLCFYTPDGLIPLFYFLTMIYFLPRAKKEVWKLTRGDFVRVRNSKGDVIGVLYVLKGTTKKIEVTLLSVMRLDISRGRLLRDVQLLNLIFTLY